jgi:delta-lactam-biosynthetic de-N-acetylase
MKRFEYHKNFSYMLLVTALLLGGLTGCSRDTLSESVPATDEELTAPATLGAATVLSGETNADQELLSLSAVPEQYSNQAISYGYSTKDRDAKNRPNSCLSSESQYSALGAHFIGTDAPIIYLTFDQGYENGYTSSILDTLKEKQVSAIFFVTGHYVNSNPDLVKRMIAEGHTIGNHSYSHPSDGLPALSTQEQIDDTLKLHQLLLDEFGYTCTLYRFPAGIYSARSMATIQSLGYTSLFWSFAYKDWIVDAQPDPDEALQRMMDQLHPGAIYLLHAVSSTNAQVLGDFIDAARAAGYTFEAYRP